MLFLHPIYNIQKIKALMSLLGGQHVVPVNVLELAIRICELYAKERDHADIDMDDSVFHISEDEWESIIFHFTKLVQ